MYLSRKAGAMDTVTGLDWPSVCVAASELDYRLLCPFLLGMTQGACQSGPALLPWAECGCLVGSCDGTIMVITVDIQQCLEKGLGDVSFPSDAIETESSVVEGLQFALLDKGRFVWIPFGAACFITSKSNDASAASN